MHWFFVIHEIIFSAPAQSRRHLPQRRRNSWPAGRTSAGSWTKHRGGSCCTPAGRPSPPNPCPPRWAGRWRRKGSATSGAAPARRPVLYPAPWTAAPSRAGRRAGTALRDARPEWRHSGACLPADGGSRCSGCPAAPASFPGARPSGPCRAENAAATGPDAAPPAGRRGR